jgi:serine/threonine-protein kinase
VSLYELVTGRLPFSGSTNYEIMTAHLHKAPVPPIELIPALPLPLSNAILRALAKDPAARFATAQEFASALHLAHISGSAETAPIAPESPGSSGKRTTLGSASGQPSASGSGMESLPLDEITKQLAVFLGPIAKLIIKKLASQCLSLDQLYSEAAKQIPAEADRQKFLYSRKK